MALALRYKAPIVLERPSEPFMDNAANTTTTTTTPTTTSRTTLVLDRYMLTLSELQEKFPHRTTVGKLQQQSTRVAANIERGYEIHKLQGALTIAMKMGDQIAAQRIRTKLDQYDSMQDLPTITTTNTVHDQIDNDNHSLDDLDNNILQ
jgi:hypothetical protein